MVKITKIVITGGPCAGKSSAMQRIKEEISKYGYTGLFVPETATELITGGVAPWTCGTNVEYQLCQMKLQKAKEAVFDSAARSMKTDKVLIVCDRGAMDNKAYMSDEEFSYALEVLGENESELRDRYDAVFHLVSTALGAKQYYTVENNVARKETAEQAAYLDRKVLEAWNGHPNLRVIDNSTDFNGKLDRLIAEILSFLGETDNCDIKRR